MRVARSYCSIVVSRTTLLASYPPRVVGEILTFLISKGTWCRRTDQHNPTGASWRGRCDSSVKTNRVDRREDRHRQEEGRQVPLQMNQSSGRGAAAGCDPSSQ